jgi:hypothetical protein
LLFISSYVPTKDAWVLVKKKNKKKRKKKREKNRKKKKRRKSIEPKYSSKFKREKYPL